jgi:hypothetical protein
MSTPVQPCVATVFTSAQHTRGMKMRVASVTFVATHGVTLLLEPGLDAGHSFNTIVLQSESDLHSPALVETAKFLQNGTFSEDIWQ